MKQGIHAEEVQFYCPSSTYPAIILLVLILLLDYRAIFDTSVEWSEEHVLKGCIKNYSIVKLFNKVLIIPNNELNDFPQQFYPLV